MQLKIGFFFISLLGVAIETVKETESLKGIRIVSRIDSHF